MSKLTVAHGKESHVLILEPGTTLTIGGLTLTVGGTKKTARKPTKRKLKVPASKALSGQVKAKRKPGRPAKKSAKDLA